MVQVIVVIAGIVVVLVVGIGIGTGIWRFYEFWRSIRQIAAQPEEVHIEVGSQGSVILFLYRKRARSYQFLPVSGVRTVALSGGLSIFTIVGPMNITARNGLAIATVMGVTPGTATLSAEAPSSQTGRQYGPVKIPVHVYSTGRVPAGITVTPPIQYLVGDPAIISEEDE